MIDKTKIPSLRFPDFNESWQLKKVSDLTKRVITPVKVDKEANYSQIGIRSHGKGLFYKKAIKGAELGNKRVFWIKENSLIINIVFAWEQAVAKTTHNEVEMVASHRFPMFQPIKGQADLDYLLHYFLTKNGKYLLQLASPGGAGRNKTLNQKEFSNLTFYVPSVEEQVKIANLLTELDNKKRALIQKKELFESYKKGLNRRIYSQELKLRDENNQDYSDWQETTLGECLSYEQPTKYIVSNKDYNNTFETPVLTAGKSFLLGYTNEKTGIYQDCPVILFDDFTTATQLVDFPFKVKSSALKILKPTKGVNIDFIYEALNYLQYDIESHSRHWLSVYSKFPINLPSISEQKRIAELFTSLRNKIQVLSNKIEQTELFKQSLIQQLFCN